MKNNVSGLLILIFLLCSCSPAAQNGLSLPTATTGIQTPTIPVSTPTSESLGNVQLTGKIVIHSSDGIYQANADGTNFMLIEEMTSPFSMMALSPNGNQFAYFKDNDVYLKDLITGTTTPLTHELIGSVGGQLRWSPDGTKLALACSTEAFSDGPLCLLDAKSGVVEKLLGVEQFPEPKNFYFLELQDWSLDGSKIVFTYFTPPEKGQKEDFEIYLYDTGTKEIRKVLDGKTQSPIRQLSNVTISPDNQTLLLNGAVSPGIMQLFSIKTDGTDFRQLTSDDKFSIENPVWSPQGLYFYASKHAPGTSANEVTELLDLDGQALLSIPVTGVIEWIK